MQIRGQELDNLHLIILARFINQGLHNLSLIVMGCIACMIHQGLDNLSPISTACSSASGVLTQDLNNLGWSYRSMRRGLPSRLTLTGDGR